MGNIYWSPFDWGPATHQDTLRLIRVVVTWIVSSKSRKFSKDQNLGCYNPRSKSNRGRHLHITRRLYKRYFEEFQHVWLHPCEQPNEKWDKIVKVWWWWKVDSSLFKNLMGSLRYLTCTRLDTLFVVGVVSHFMEASTFTHLKVARRILHCLQGTIDLGLLYSFSDDFNLVGFCASDYVGDVDDEKAY